MNGAMTILWLIWGLNWVVMKQANQVFPPILFTTYRFALGAIVLLGIACWQKVPLPQRKDWKWIIIGGLLQTTFFNTAVQVGMQYLSAGFSSVLSYSMPFWVTIMAHFFLGERLNKSKLMGVALGMAGLAALFNVNGGGAIWAVILTLAGAMAWAFTSILVKWKLHDCNSLQFTTWQMAVGSCVLVFYSAIFEHGTVQWGWPAVGYLLYNGVLASALAFYLWTYILSNTAASKASMSVLAIPIIGVLAGVLLLHEPLHWNTMIGMVLILGGIWLVISQHDKNEKNLADEGI